MWGKTSRGKGGARDPAAGAAARVVHVIEEMAGLDEGGEGATLMCAEGFKAYADDCIWVSEAEPWLCLGCVAVCVRAACVVRESVLAFHAPFAFSPATTTSAALLPLAPNPCHAVSVTPPTPHTLPIHCHPPCLLSCTHRTTGSACAR